MSPREDHDPDGFAGRWSRRKAAARRDLEDPAADAPAEAAQPAAPDPPDARTDEEILRDLDLPDPDGLASGDDFSRFMKRDVPARLRRRALRRLWASDPKLAAVDGLLEYGGDYTDAATAAGTVATAYEVGRGFIRRIEEEAARAEAEAAARRERDGDAPETDAPSGEEPAPDAPEAAADEGEAPEDAPAAETEIAEAPRTGTGERSPAPARRRMRFDFD